MYHGSRDVTLMAENVTRSKSEITVSVSVSAKILKNMICAKNAITCSCKNVKYLTSIIDNSVIACDEIK